MFLESGRTMLDLFYEGGIVIIMSLNFRNEFNEEIINYYLFLCSDINYCDTSNVL